MVWKSSQQFKYLEDSHEIQNEMKLFPTVNLDFSKTHYSTVFQSCLLETIPQ